MIKRAIIALGILLMVSSSLAAQGRYKKYERPQSDDYLLEITMLKKTYEFSFKSGDSLVTFSFAKTDVKKQKLSVSIKDSLSLDSTGIHYRDRNISPDDIDKISVTIEPDNVVRVYLRGPDTTSDSKFRRRRNNQIAIRDTLNIAADDFVRGTVLGFWTDITIDGEVNEDVVAFFGNINVTDNAVIRGDIIAMNGTIEASRKATIYGEVLSSGLKKRHRFDRWSNWYRRDSYISVIGRFYYNRVDGAAPYLGLGFIDEDSLLPSVEIIGGYAFASERWRYQLAVEQSFFRKRPLTIGANVYKQPSSSDDRLINEPENTAFALLATEDFKDYYDAEGVYGFIRWTPIVGNSYEVGIRAERQGWLDGHPGLWSLFGGSKRFSENFGYLAESEQATAKQQIDHQDLIALCGRITMKTDGAEELPEISYWEGSLDFEWAPVDWGEDFDYSRYVISATRYQRLNDLTGLLFRGVYGGSDGNLPYHKKYYLGGPGTLYGYLHKEYSGTEFWMADLEYRIGFPNIDFTGWLFYEVGQIGDGAGTIGDAEIKHSLGIGLSLGTDIRLNIAQRLDRAGASPRLYVRLGRLF
ncbi:MAG: BamA/TamA family outer membrane protein [candidate division Zixibacteria bacterium]|nr:BamA/TamA family outer membrane protein [candidate division Zixibacteria bacterium]